MIKKYTLELPSYLSDGMILQQNSPIKIKGKDALDTRVTVSFAEETVEAVADVSGQWAVELSPMPAGGPYQLTVKGSGEIVIADVYLGEVWLLGGQSNMELPIHRTYDAFKEEIDRADYPLIRQFHLEMDPVFDEPKTWLTQGQWKSATQEDVQDFSSLGFFYARQLHEKLKVPVGLYHTAVGATPIEAWMCEETLHELGEYDEELAYWKDPENVEKERVKDLKSNQEWYADLYENDRGLLDETQWMEETVDLNVWLSMDLPVMFKDTALAGFSGVVWFRRTFDVTEEQLESERFRLRLGSLINGDETYLNGIKVGETDYRYPPRKYVLKKEDLQTGTNTLVVRLMIDAANGGFIPTFPYQLELDDETIDLKGEWLYKIGCQKEVIAPALFLQYKPASEYKGMLYPLKDVTFKGALFYQGEANTKAPTGYKELMTRMVKDWRALFQQEDLPFYYVQLANYIDPAAMSDAKNWAELRYEQDRARFLIEHSEMVPALDCGISYELHPYDKKTLAERLARVALSRDYKKEEEYENLEVNDVSQSVRSVSVKIKGLKGQLALSENVPEVEIRRNGTWEEVTVTDISENEVTFAVSGSADSDPVSEVRYAWRNDPKGYIYDTETGLPLLPFVYKLG